MASLIYIIGVVLSIIAVLDILKKPISLVGKIISWFWHSAGLACLFTSCLHATA